MENTAGARVQSLRLFTSHTRSVRTTQRSIDGMRLRCAAACRNEPGSSSDAVERAQPQQHLVVRHASESGVQRADGLQVELETLRVERAARFARAAPIRLRAVSAPRAAALEFGGEAHHHRREPLLERLGGAGIVDLRIDAEAHRAVDFVARIAHRNRDRVAASPRACRTESSACRSNRAPGSPRPADDPPEAGNPRSRAACRRRRRETRRCRPPVPARDDLSERIQRLARSGLGGFCQLVEHGRHTHGRLI